MLRRLSEPLREAGLIFLISRGALFLLAPLAYLSLPKIDPSIQWQSPNVMPRITETLSGLPHYLVDIWARWDVVWYLQIAEQGYQADDFSAAFFPLYPLLIAIIKPLFFGNGLLAGMTISLVCCFGAFYYLYKLLELDFDAGIARKTVFFIAIFPTTFYLQAVYTESLFLFLTVFCFYAARRNLFLVACIAGALATLTRSAGLILVVPLAIMYMSEREWKLNRVRPDIIYLLLVPLGLIAYMLFLDIKFGDPWLFSSAQSFWSRDFTGPIGGIYNGIKAAFWGMDSIVNTPDTTYWLPVMDNDPRVWAVYDVINLLFLVPALVISIVAFWKLPLHYALYALLLLVMPLSYPSSIPLMSIPRFILTIFPLFILLAIWARERPWFDKTVTMTSLLLLGLFLSKFVIWTWVA
jgi:Gpi18-like mannosyltransferase